MLVTTFLGVTFLAVVVLLSFFWRLARWEIAWDWRLVSFGWHAFVLGAFVGGVGCLMLIARFHAQIFR